MPIDDFGAKRSIKFVCVFLFFASLCACGVCSNDLPEDLHINKLLGALTSRPGFGTHCMEGEISG